MLVASLDKARRQASHSLPAWVLGCAALVAAVFFVQPFPWSASPLGVTCQDLAIGESLLHGFGSKDISYSMPMQSVLCAAVRHVPAGSQPACVLALWSAALLLAFTLGCLLHSPLAGGLSALAASRLIVPGLEYDNVYPLFVLLVANVLVWAGRGPGLGQGLALGAAVGLSVLERSPLFLFPFVAAGYSLWVQDPGSRGRRWPYAASLVAVPALILLPWVWMNYALHGRIILFEENRAAFNIVTGAIGAVSTIEGDLRHLVSLADGTGALAWALGRILEHPLDFLKVFGARAVSILGEHPALFLLAAAGAFFSRSRHEFRLCGLLVAYYLAVHCLMSVRPRYFTPVWPVLCGMSAGFLAELALPVSGRPGTRLCAGVVSALYALCAGMGLFVLAKVMAHPARPDRARLEERLSARPDLACLWAESGRERLARGDIKAGLADLRRALLLGPRPDRALELARALILADSPQQGLVHSLDQTGADWNDRVRRHLLRALAFLREGRSREAEAAFGEAERLRSPVDTPALRSTPYDRELQERLNIGYRLLYRELAALLKPLPPAEQIALLQRGLVPGRGAKERASPFALLLRDSDWWLDVAGQAHAAGDGKGFLAAGLQAAQERLSPAAAAALLDRCRGIGDPALAVPLLRRLAALRPRDPAVLLALASGNLKLKAGAEARRWLERSTSLPLGQAQLHQALDLCRALADQGCARRLLELSTKLHPRNPGYWLERAHLAAQTGRRKEAAAHLREALALPLQAAGLLRAAGICRNMGEDGREFELLARLSHAEPDDPGLWLAMADLAAEGGRRGEAIAYLDRADSPGLAPDQRLKQAIILQRLGLLSRALAILDSLAAADPRNAGYLSSRGVVRALLGRGPDAVSDLRQAVSLDPRSLQSYLSLGSLLDSSCRTDEAIRVYQDALRRPGSDQPAVRQAIRRSRAVLLERRKAGASRAGCGSAPRR
ncbi:MAG: tetratricopeptide repeat protein [Elusimicrobia bacterium]|nr:tetratricopeptide repeat protein [Elusimicrobiota bacterium]